MNFIHHDTSYLTYGGIFSTLGHFCQFVPTWLLLGINKQTKGRVELITSHMVLMNLFEIIILKNTKDS